MNTEDSLRAVLSYVARTELPAELLLLTGDLVHDASPRAYRRLATQVDALGVPVRWLPGNHDQPALMRTALNTATMEGPGVTFLPQWMVVTLDCTIPGEEGGRLASRELARLDGVLAGHPDRYALIALHHPPVPSGTPAMDAITLSNPDALFTVLERHSRVRAVTCGHYHFEMAREHAGVQVYVTPSTCYQLRLGGPDITFDDEARPGYRRLELGRDGSVRTRIVRVALPPARG